MKKINFILWMIALAVITLAFTRELERNKREEVRQEAYEKALEDAYVQHWRTIKSISEAAGLDFKTFVEEVEIKADRKIWDKVKDL